MACRRLTLDKETILGKINANGVFGKKVVADKHIGAGRLFG
jgi:hypothetical protein